MAFYSLNLKNAAYVNAIDLLKRYKVDASPEDHDITYWETERAESYLGTPIFAPILIKPVTYTEDDGTEITVDGIFIDTILMTITQTKNIEKTVITGRKGTIKEYISDGDYSVDLDIIIASKVPNVFPKEASDRLIKLLQAPKELEVVSEVLNRYGIDSLVVEDFKNPQRRGFPNLDLFSVRCSSEKPLELRVKEEG